MSDDEDQGVLVRESRHIRQTHAERLKLAWCGPEAAHAIHATQGEGLAPMSDEYIDFEAEPWRADGRSVYEWLAERSNLHDEGQWDPKPVAYRYVGMDVEPPDGPGVYFLLADDLKMLYIGKATQISRRLQGHFVKGLVPFTKVWWLEAPLRAAEVLEAHLLSVGLPPYNVKFDPGQKSDSAKLKAEIDSRRPL